MPEFDLSSFLNDAMVFRDVISEKHPKGKTYTAPSLPHRDKLALMAIAEKPQGPKATKQQQAAFNKAIEAFSVDDKGKPVDLLQRLIGAKTYREMVDDGVPTAAMDAMQTIAVATYTADADAALAWLAAETGKVLAGPGNREQRRAAAKKSTSSSRTAGSNTTRPPGSRSKAASSSATRARTTGQASTSGPGTSAGRSKAS